MAEGTDRITAHCVGCGLDFDVWGDWTPQGFDPEEPERLCCPSCLFVAQKYSDPGALDEQPRPLRVARSL